MTLREFQQLIRNMYHDKDAARGVEGTFMWLTEEIGELATALRSGSPEEQALEFADVLAWLATIANVVDIDLEQAIVKNMDRAVPAAGKFFAPAPMRRSHDDFEATPALLLFFVCHASDWHGDI